MTNCAECVRIKYPEGKNIYFQKEKLIMKKSIIAIVLAVATLVTFIIPASAWSWKEEGEWQVATYWIPIAKDGEIKVDAELEAKYLEGDKVESYPDESPYRRSGYEARQDATFPFLPRRAGIPLPHPRS